MHRIEEPAPPPAHRYALLDLGFRPFYLLASVFAASSVPLWALQFSGLWPHAYLAGPAWHAHEMLFGFVLAVLVGFLFTAGRNWSNRPTPSGPVLGALVALWIAGRVLVLSPWHGLAAVVDTSFPLAAALALAVPFWRSRNRRNYFFVGLLFGLGLLNGFMHLAFLSVIERPASMDLRLGLDLVLFIVAVMAGRVVPMFTNNGVPGAGATRHPAVERLCLGLVLLLVAADGLGASAWATTPVAAAAGLAHAARWLLWRPWKVGRTPLVWVLHASYAWVPVHLALRAIADLGLIAPSLATHALTVGAIGGLVIGMMTRTARGHTARPLRADRCDVACYLAVLGAGVVRVGLPLVQPLVETPLTLVAVQASALLWSCGYALYAVRYWPVLSQPRLDGRRG